MPTVLNWYIDPLLGKDTPPNNGQSPTSAFKTFKKLSGILGQLKFLSAPGKNITVHILNDLPNTDPLNFDVILDHNTSIVFQGNERDPDAPFPAASELKVSTLTAKSRPNNIPAQFTSLPRPDYFPPGSRIYNENKDAYTWLVSNPVDSNKALYRISELLTIPKKMTTDSDFGSKDNRRNHDPNDKYYIEPLLKVCPGSMRVGSVNNGPYNPKTLTLSKLVFKDLNITGNINPEMDMGMRLFCYGCKLDGSILLNSGFDRNFFNCYQPTGHVTRIISGLTRFYGGAYVGDPKSTNSQFFLPTNCTTQFDIDVIFQSHSLSFVAGNTLIIGTAGIFDSVPGGNGRTNNAGNGIMASAGSVTCRRLLDSTYHLWGSGNLGAGVGVSSGGRFHYVDYPTAPDNTQTGELPTITGTNDFRLGENSSVSSYAPNDDGTFSGPYFNSWVNLKKAIPQTAADPPGFGGNAANPKHDAWIIKTQ